MVIVLVPAAGISDPQRVLPSVLYASIRPKMVK